MKNLVQAWPISSKRVVSNHEGVNGPGELEGSVQDLIFPLRMGFKDLSVLVIGDDDSLLLIGILDDHKVVVGKVLHDEQDLFLFKGSQDDLILKPGACEHLPWQKNCHIVTLLPEELVCNFQPLGRAVETKSTSPCHVGSVNHDKPQVAWFGFQSRARFREI